MLKILLVEDDECMVKLATVILKRHMGNVEIDIARNGFDGYNKAIDGDHDIFICDIQMPVMDGLEMIQKIRRHGCWTPAIALTGYSNKWECIDAGYDNYISKPYTREDLISKVTDFACANIS